tara:strand:+ start:2209 stop:2544 length:336 start_codon:yes stop_codon:yes gene_type:complete
MPIAKKKKRAAPTYASYIHKVLQQLSPRDFTGITISSKSVQLINGILNDIEGRISDKAFALSRFDKKSTLSPAHVKSAVSVLFPLELSRHAASEILKAEQKYLNSQSVPAH